MKLDGSVVTSFFRDAFSLKADCASAEEIQNSIQSGAKIKGTNMCILILAILIASIGLNMNSTAVIIGAMLISPLMGGIMAIGYGIATNDLKTAKSAAFGLLFQVVICILTSTIYFTLTPISTAHSELLARTSPSIWDVLIAICGGLAGIIGVTRKEKTNVIPGVAIATALMPPLCTAGFGLAAHKLSYFLGAMYLFFINSFFICLTTVVIVKILKLPCKTMLDKKAQNRLRINIAVIAVVTVIPSIILAYGIVKDAVTERNVTNYLSEQFAFSDTQVVKSNLNQDKKTIEVALIGKRVSDDVLQTLEKQLPKYGLDGMSLKVTQTDLGGAVTQDEVKELLDSDENINVALKDQEINGLKNQIEEYQNNEKLYQNQISELKEKIEGYQKKEFNAEALSKELIALYPEVTGCSVGFQNDWNKDATGQQEILAVTIKGRNITTSKKNKIADWFQVKTGAKTVKVYVNPK
ncbi:MAG: TIGR00341 family protein [Clostridiales bacterium]|nr:TIGR00341 family protein [Clostridiales bacterium]